MCPKKYSYLHRAHRPENAQPEEHDDRLANELERIIEEAEAAEDPHGEAVEGAQESRP